MKETKKHVHTTHCKHNTSNCETKGSNSNKANAVAAGIPSTYMNQLSTEEYSEQEEPATKQQKAYQFQISGLDCAACATKIENELHKKAYISYVSINFVKSLIDIELKETMDKNELLLHLNEVSNKLEPGSKIFDANHTDIDKNSNQKSIIKLAIGCILFAGAIVMEDSFMIHPFYLFIVPYLFIGSSVLWKSIRNIIRGDIFDENFLMTVATIAAFVVGEYSEGIAVMLLYNVGEIFQSYAVNHSRKSIAELMDIKSEYANLIIEGKEKQVDPRMLEINNIINVKVGERIPIDGVIIDGHTSLDVSALTGEAALKDVGEDDDVLAGSINTSGLIKVKVTKNFEDSTVAKILELVENAANKKAPIENFITKFAKIYTPIVVALATMLVIIPTLIYGPTELNTWLYRGATFLVISCPCALVVSVPLGVFAGIGSASRIGALVKGGTYLEKLNDVNTIVFDKTGTITKGNFKVSEIVGKRNLLEIAAYGESYSNHPIAKSILQEYNQSIDFERMQNYKEIAGYGIKVTLDAKSLVIGNSLLMKKEQIEYDNVVAFGTIIHVAYDYEYIGYLVISDEIKETSKTAISELKALGIHETIMLTGDQEGVAQAIAKEVGITKVHAQLLPQDKVHILETYLNDRERVVAFVGDGINDAPALMRSDVGISMGGIGSDVAIEASDVVLMNDELTLIPSAIRISKKTKFILKQNIIFAIGVKVVVLILTTFGVTNMWMGVFADVGVTILAILNSMRILTPPKK